MTGYQVHTGDSVPVIGGGGGGGGGEYVCNVQVLVVGGLSQSSQCVCVCVIGGGGVCVMCSC